MPSNLRIDPERLWSTLMETAAIGGTAKGGINRQTLTVEDAKVRTWFKRTTEALGCKVSVDEVGNMFALRPGRRADLAPIALGSHLDTQPTGGKFDGNLGVLGALEALRTLVAAGYETNAPFVVVNWTNEEGARFAPAMLGSGVFAGVYGRAEADAITDIAGVRLGDALDAIGWRGEAKIGMPLSAYLELHIEQGPILEAEDKTIGVVTGVQGVRWYEASITGRESDAGTTPMPRRADAMVACARLALEVQRIALAHAPTAVGTVGRVEVEPNSPNVIPGVVRMTVDCATTTIPCCPRWRRASMAPSTPSAARSRSRSRPRSCTISPPSASIPIAWRLCERAPRRSDTPIATSSPAPATMPCTCRRSRRRP